jgi:hypothetical protein
MGRIYGTLIICAAIEHVIILQNNSFIERSTNTDKSTVCRHKSRAIMYQSWISSSFLMISLTSLNPPASFLTLLGLLVSTSLALSSLPLTGGPGLGGAAGLQGLRSTFSAAEGLGAGISSHSSPAMSMSFKKNGQRVVRRLRDS